MPVVKIFLAGDPALSHWNGSTDSNTLYNQTTPNSRKYQIVRTHSHKVNHLNTRPGITQPPVTPSEGHLIQTAIGQKKKPNHQQTGLLPHSALHTRRGKKNSTQISPNSKLTQKPLDQT